MQGVFFDETMKNKLLVISGQTATGKTKLGVYLAKKYDGEIVSFDARQAYRYLDIVTGKERADIPIWLYDVVDPKEYISAYDFCQKAEIVIKDIIKRGKLPIIVGGSVFYIKTFLHGVQSAGIAPDWNARKKLEILHVYSLKTMLSSCDLSRLTAMNESDKVNKRRLIRAIEVAKGQSKKDIYPKKKDPYDVLFIALVARNKKILEGAIGKRVEERMRMGVLVEVKTLLGRGYAASDPGLSTIGYRQLLLYIEEKISLGVAKEAWIREEMQYAKRQYTFLKKMPGVHFFDTKDTHLIEKIDTIVYKWLYDSKN